MEIIGITIALVSSMALIITSATANARLTRQNYALRNQVSALRNYVR
jgi:hypothetical protein